MAAYPTTFTIAQVEAMNDIQFALILANGHRPEDFPPNDANMVLRHHPDIPGMVVVSTFALHANLRGRVALVNGGIQDDDEYWETFLQEPFRFFQLEHRFTRWDPSLVSQQLDIHGPQHIQGVHDFYGILLATVAEYGIMGAREYRDPCSCCRNDNDDPSLQTPYHSCSHLREGNRACANCFYLLARDRLPQRHCEHSMSHKGLPHTCQYGANTR